MNNFFSEPRAKGRKGASRNKIGRLDVAKVAELFGLKVSELARYLEVEEEALLCTPDSKLVQERLLPYEQIAGALNLMEGDAGKFQRWLNSPNDELNGQRPIKLIREGKTEVLAGLVQAVLLGQPA